jgi:hypothetical protein
MKQKHLSNWKVFVYSVIVIYIGLGAVEIINFGKKQKCFQKEAV